MDQGPRRLPEHPAPIPPLRTACPSPGRQRMGGLAREAMNAMRAVASAVSWKTHAAEGAREHECPAA